VFWETNVFHRYTELFKMVCEENETDVDIGIPAVMLPQDAGLTLERHIENKSNGMIDFLWAVSCCVINYGFSFGTGQFNF